MKLHLCHVLPLRLQQGTPNPYPFNEGDVVLVLGKIKHMPGHVAVITRDGKTHFGFHADHFRKLSKEEC